MTDKYKYGSVSLKNKTLENIDILSQNLPTSKKLSKAKTIEVSINAVSDVLRDSKKRNITNGNAKNKSTD
jgi:hypothetical protein|tara:strand:+ start:1794 stop:2003 length:210 start_codon:yes stop_codon:yes gene_type:complete